MIKLTTKNRETIIIAPEHVRRIEPNGNHENACYVDSIYVTESPEEVTRKILEYKLAMARYGIRFEQSTGATNELVALIKLAGLED